MPKSTSCAANTIYVGGRKVERGSGKAAWVLTPDGVRRVYGSDSVLKYTGGDRTTELPAVVTDAQDGPPDPSAFGDLTVSAATSRGRAGRRSMLGLRDDLPLAGSRGAVTRPDGESLDAASQQGRQVWAFGAATASAGDAVAGSGGRAVDGGSASLAALDLPFPPSDALLAGDPEDLDAMGALAVLGLRRAGWDPKADPTSLERVKTLASADPGAPTGGLARRLATMMSQDGVSADDQVEAAQLWLLGREHEIPGFDETWTIPARGFGELDASVAMSQRQLDQVKELDDLAFGGHQGIPADVLADIARDTGVVHALWDRDTGQVVGESQLTMTRMPDAEEPLLQTLPSDVGYFEGAAVHPDHQGKGLQRELQRLRRDHCVDAGKEAAVCTVRLENPASVVNLMKEGFVLASADEDYYGSADDPSAHRVVMLNHFSAATAPPSTEQAQAAPVVGEARASDAPVVKLPIRAGDDADLTAREQMDALLARGYVGVGSQKSDRDGEYVMLFSRLDNLPDDVRDTTRHHQQWVTESTGRDPSSVGMG